MSFFGFDTSMPPGMGRGNAGESMDERLRRMAEADENLEIYDFADDDLGELAAKLDESLDAFNEDTFDVGGPSGNGSVGRDFDFSGNTASFLGGPAQSQSQPQQSQQQQQFQQSQPNYARPSPFSVSFDADPLLGPVRQGGVGNNGNRGPATPFQRQPSYGAAQTQSQGQVQAQAQAKPRHRTLEEIEAEMAQKQQQSQQLQSQQRVQLSASPMLQARPSPGLGPGAGRALTVEEVEAEMMRKANEARGMQQQVQQYPPGMGMGAMAPSPHAMMQRQPSGQQVQTQALAQQAQMMGMRQQQPSRQQQEQRMPLSPMGGAQPQPGQQPSDMLSQLFSAQGQTQPSAPPGISLEDPNIQSTIQARLQTAEALEASRRRKAYKIHLMAKYNNLMTQGDKDFITRIQVSQLINSAGISGTHDPYKDDFYFAVVQSLRRNRALAQNGAMERQMREMMTTATKGERSEAEVGVEGKQGGPGGGMVSPGPAPTPAGAPSNAGGGPLLPTRGAQMNQNDRRRNARANQQETQRMTRRENAMNRMAQQVQRLVDDAKKKPRATQLSLEGALGKIAIRTRSAPRPLLQVENKRSSTAGEDTLNPSSAAAANSLSSSLNRGNPASQHRAALDKRQVLIALERVYDIVLQLEQSRRSQPSLEAAAQAESQASEAHGNPADFPTHARRALEEHESKYRELVAEMWKGMKVMEPLDISSPHPFISLLSATKGKKLLPRVLRHTDSQQTLTLLTLLVATFDTLDVVRDAPVLDMNPNDPLFNAPSAAYGPGRRTRKEVEGETETFLNATIPLVMSTIGRAPLRIVTGMLGLLIERNDLIRLARTKPGLAFLTIFVTRAESLKQQTSEATNSDSPTPEHAELDQWTGTFNHLSARLSGHLPSLFPSTRSVPFGPGMYTSSISSASSEAILDSEDEPVWHFLAALAVSSDMSQQQGLVTEVREKVLENCMKAKNAERTAQAQGQNKEAAEMIAGNKIRNVNTFLHALGLDASQITVD